MTTPKDLRTRFPYQFEGTSLGVAFTRGWFPLLVQLCTDVDAALGEDKRGFYWHQIKEKFGSLRVVFRLADGVFEREQELARKIFALTSAAEKASETVCAACSQSGVIDPRSGFVLALCSTHHSHRVVGIPLSVWYDVEEESL